MNVIHALAWYFPESTGGTEVYVSGLVSELQSLGVKNCVAAAGPGSVDYEYEGIPVHRYTFGPTDLATVRGDREPRGFDMFTAWLSQQPAGIYHQHSWTTSCGLHHLRAAKSLGFKTVLTVHVPSNICMRGTMMEFGDSPCDGRVAAGRCAACWSQAQGLPRFAARALPRLPLWASDMAYRRGSVSRALTALSARPLAAARQQQIGAMAAAADRVVAVCDWLGAALRRNGLGDDKVVVSRQGVDRAFAARPAALVHKAHTFRLGYLGRCDPVKGLAVLLAAIARLPAELPIEVLIFAVANTEEDRRHRDALIATTANDPRIKFLPSVSRTDVPAVLGSFDMLAVPSQWMETGPLVVAEAQALGVPVLGSNIGGIAELITPGVNGHLVEFSNPAAWANAIHAAVTGTLTCLKNRPPPKLVRTMADAAGDMTALYAGLA